ncbi:hypothetical protein EAI_02913, partial [Harpegnathos saltator]
PVVIAGDFIAHSEGGSPGQRDPRGEPGIGWAAGLGLLLMNRGSTSTCVRPGGWSVIDLTWATPSVAGMFHEWRVEAEDESLSDHRHI